MKKQLIVATLALALAVGTSVVSFAQNPETTTTLSAVDEQTEFAWGLGKSCCGRYSDAKRNTKEERGVRRAGFANLTEEEKEELIAQRKACRVEFEKLTDEEKEAFLAEKKATRETRRAEFEKLTDEEKEVFLAEKKATREARRAECPLLAGNEKPLN